ncbi:innexin unc-9-like isoform X1 [Mercenaria mercenaria]|uniref:innexin unc-9-like isoform X1 n=1 Tax=Mercenaria mercenaria TaxID=6596 RepID=UPI001E1D74D3|nr:innexin unc-9-like isoform X1 [Mercenaria mercenaria]
MARKGGGGARRSGGRRSGGAGRKGRSGMRRQMRRGMRNMRMGKGMQGKAPKMKKSGSGMNNIKLGAAMAATRGFGTAGYHQGTGQGGFGANEESAVEQEMAYMSVYDQMLDDEGDQVQQHLEILSQEGLDSVLGSFATYARLKGRYDDDWIDRLNHLYTTIIFIIFTIVVSTKQYVGEPIHCWCPAEFTDAMVDYTNNVCWVSNTYFVHFDNDIPKYDYTKKETEIGYYQWVPMILLFQALLFKIPCILWRILTASAGVNLDKIVTLAAETQYISPEERERTIRHIVKYMDRWLENAREYRSGCFIRLRQTISKFCCIVCGKRYGNYLVTIYMFIKLLYMTNAVGQLFILNEFLGTNYNAYGFEVMGKLSRGEDFEESPRFPRVTMCDFSIRQLRNVQQYSVQCVLPINLFNEKIFMFIWFWLVAVSVLSTANFLIWAYIMIFRQHRIRYMKKFLRVNDCYKSELDKKMAVKFCEQYLRQDGIFVLRLVGKNANDVLVSELIVQLWHYYRNKPLFKHATNQISDDNSNV